MSDFSIRLLSELKFLGKSQADLARFLGVRQSTVQQWIQKGSIPAADTALKIAQFINVSLEYLITGKNPPPKTEKVIKNYDSDISEIVELLELLPDDEREEVKEIIKVKCKKWAKNGQKIHEKKDLLNLQFD